MGDHLQLLMDTAPIAVCIFDNDLNFLKCNQEFIKMFDLSSQKDFYENLCTLMPPYQPSGNHSKDTFCAMLNDALLNGQTTAEFMYQHPSGITLPTETTFSRAQYESNFVVVGYIRNLTAMYDKIRRGEVAQEESLAKTQFLARMSHEIRTPVGVISGIADIQLQKRHHPPDTEEAFLQIQKSSALLTTIINDILDLSKVAAGKMQIVEKPYETASLIIDTVQFNIMHRGSKHIKFLLDADEHLPAYLVGDELRIKQILNNLLSNAFKYTNCGYVHLSFGVETSYNEDGEKQDILTFTVSDTGRGMTDDQIESLFNTEYVRFNEEDNQYTPGVGLGMSITYQLLKLMNGQIEVDSKKGEGTLFHIRIPQLQQGDQVLGKETAEKLKNYEFSQLTLHKKNGFTYEPMPYGRVLIVDDHDSNLYVARGLLLPYGLQIDTSDSGYEAVEKIANGEVYDVIFMDHMMPGIDGIETAKQIKGLGYTLPIVALTANSILGQAELFMNNGFAGFLSKPIDLNQLNSFLIRLIRDKYPPEIVENAKLSNPNNEKLHVGITQAFINDTERALAYFERFVNRPWTDEELKIFTTTVHGMKSALENIGESLLADLAATLEAAARDSNLIPINKNIAVFMDNLSALYHFLIRQEKEVNDPCGDTAYLMDRLQVIQWDAESYNKRGAKSALDELSNRSWPKETSDLINKLSGLLLHSEFDEAAKLAQKTLTSLRD